MPKAFSAELNSSTDSSSEPSPTGINLLKMLSNAGLLNNYINEVELVLHIRNSADLSIL